MHCVDSKVLCLIFCVGGRVQIPCDLGIIGQYQALLDINKRPKLCITKCADLMVGYDKGWYSGGREGGEGVCQTLVWYAQ